MSVTGRNFADFPEIPAECFTSKTEEEKEEDRKAYGRYADIISHLPLDESWNRRRKYQNMWFYEPSLPCIMAMQERLRLRDDDILLASYMKSGSTWQRAITFAIVNRRLSNLEELLRSRHANHCAVFLETLFLQDGFPNLEAIPTPRLFATHVPYSLIDSVRDSQVKIFYICREPKDTLVSMWHFLNKASKEPASFDKAFQLFCSGMFSYGPIWNHMLEYWYESQRRPEKVLFMKYEDLMADPEGNVRRIAEFIGHPFEENEEKEGIVEKIVKLCSFEKLSSLEVNKVGKTAGNFDNSTFFRKGKVGDWENHFTTEMAETLDAITDQKLRGSGLSFK